MLLNNTDEGLGGKAESPQGHAVTAYQRGSRAGNVPGAASQHVNWHPHVTRYGKGCAADRAFFLDPWPRPKQKAKDPQHLSLVLGWAPSTRG